MFRPHVEVSSPILFVRSALQEAIDRYDPEMTLSPATALRAAEVAIYLGHLHEAEVALEIAHESTLTSILQAELQLGRGEYESALHILDLLDDSDALAARIAFDKARASQMLERWDDMLRYAELAIVTAQCDGDRAIEGLGYRCRAIALRECGGRDDHIERDFIQAVRLLRESEDLRFRAFAELSYASLLAVTGRTDEAADLIELALLTFGGLGIERDSQNAMHARAFVDLIAGNYQAALDRALTAIPIDRAQRSAKGESWALKIAALAAAYAGQIDRAVEYADALVSLCQMACSISELVEAHVIRFRARARAGDRTAIADLEAFMPAVLALEKPVVTATARAVLADALLGEHPDLRAFAARDAAEPEGVPAQPWLVAELRHLHARWERQPIRREANRLVVDLTRASSLESEHMILDFARLGAAESRAHRVEDAAPDLGLSRRTFFKVRAAVKTRLAGEGTKPRRRRVR
jgi:tetratricopeptide (TPR) repeat protein